MKDPRFNTGDAELDRALELDDAKLGALGAYDDKPAPYAREFIYTDVAGGNWRVFRREDDSRVATCWDAHNAQLIVDALNRDAAPSVSSSAPPPTWDEMASMFPDNTKRADRPRGSSAEPAPPTKKCSECRTSLNDGEGKCFTVCDQCWDKTYRTISGAEKSSPVPVQEEATPTLDPARLEDVLDSAALHFDNLARDHRAERMKGSDLKAKDAERDAADIRALASALPALLEARALEIATEEAALSHDKNHVTRKEKAWQTIRDAATTLGNSDLLGAVHVYAATHHFASRVRIEHDLAAMYEKQLAGSISERETLTAELEKFRGWFQNAEQARAVAESKLASRSVTRCQKCGAEALPSPTHALDLEAERDDARADVERLTREKAQYDADLAAAAGELLVPIPEAGTDAARMLIANRLLKSQLEAAKQFREQAIQDIEALPRPEFFDRSEDYMRSEYPVNDCKNMDDPIDELIATQAFARAVLLILREAPTNA